MKKIISAFIAIAILSGCSHAEQTPQTRYLVEFKVTEHEKVLGSPRILVESGKTASMSIRGEDGYELAVYVVPAQGNTAMVNTTLTTSSGVIEPTLLVNPGEEASAMSNGVGITVLVNEIRN